MVMDLWRLRLFIVMDWEIILLSFIILDGSKIEILIFLLNLRLF